MGGTGPDRLVRPVPRTEVGLSSQEVAPSGHTENGHRTLVLVPWKEHLTRKTHKQNINQGNCKQVQEEMARFQTICFLKDLLFQIEKRFQVFRTISSPAIAIVGHVSCQVSTGLFSVVSPLSSHLKILTHCTFK